ncbi:hypothetical protein WME90_40690 [Sorangium sp. So ce375]|uniref:hypothetical protein n=1 Tax=Sorangium sp. So ce375 TaxID=3133306 RepID=UPI003F5CA9A8
MMIKGIVKVSPVAAGDEDDLNRQRVERELLDKILALLGEESASSSARAPRSSRRSSAAGP